MGLKFRRGTNAQKSGSLAFGEPYVNTDLNTLMVGGAAGDITLATSTAAGTYATTGSNTFIGDQTITGSLGVSGNLTLGGNITIGDATSDTLSVTANLSSSLIPQTGSTFNLGSSSKPYRTVHGDILSGSVLEIMSGSNPELRLINNTTNIQYHIQNGDAGNFTIHNGTTDNLLFRFMSASLEHGPQDAQFFGTLYVSKSISSPTITGINTFTGSTNTRLTNLENTTSSLATTGSNTLKGNQTIIGTGTGFAAYISTSVNDGTLGLDTTANVNAMYFLKNGEKNFEASYDTTNANGIFRLLPYDNNSFVQIGNPSNSANNNTDYVFIAESTYGNVLIGPGIGNATSYLGGATPLTDKVQIAGNLYVSGAIKANSFTGSIAATNGVVSGSSQVVGILSSLNTYTSSLNSAIQLTGSTVSFLGDIVVYGTQSIINSTNLAVNDNLIYLNEGSTVTNPDLGIVGNYNDGTYAHGGIFRDASDGGAWKVFEGYTLEPSGTIDTTGNGFTLADFKADVITATSFNGTINATNGVVSGSSQVNADSITNFDSNVLAYNNSLGVISGSSQINVASTTGDIALGSRTSGNYVASLVAGTNITLSNNSGEGATPTIGLTNNAITIAGQSTALGSSVTAETIRVAIGTVVTGSSQIAFGGITGLVSNSQLANSSITIAGQLTALGSSVTADTIRAAIGTVVTGSSQINLGSATGNIALATQTTGDYVASLVAGTGITLSNNSGENATPTIAIGQSVATNATPTFGNLTINGSINATGDITAYYTSDKRHKNNIQPIENALLKVSKLNGVTWEWNDDVHEVTKSTPKTGLIAQEVQEVLPEVIKEREDGFLALDYSKMMGLMVEAIKEQQTQIHNLTLEIENLKKVKGL